MKKLLQVSILALLAVMWVMIGLSYADTHTASSCSLAHVQAAHDAAVRGDTVAVPAGSCTWVSSLNITKSITLSGAGAGSTIITTGFSAVSGAGWGLVTGQNLIYIKPSSIADDTNVLMRVTGFTFVLTSGSYKVGGILVNNFSNTPLNKFRVDNNIFSNAYYDGNNNAYCAIGAAYSTVYGVIDNNTFTGQPHIYLKGRGQTAWNAFNWTYGTANSMYIEDNTFTVTDLPNNNGNGASNVWRYNDITISTDTWSLDLGNSHGNDVNTGTWSSFGSEIYGNKVTLGVGDTFVRFGAIRGGKNVMFYNKVLSGSNIGVMEYEGTNGNYGYDYGSTTNTVCPTGTLYANGSRTGCSPNGSPQHVNQTYIWNNREGAGDGTIMDITNYKPTCASPPCATQPLTQNTHFFTDYGSTTYMGCGTSLPTPWSCSVGAGYWVTDQSCTTVPAAGLGASPTTPIAGTLYRCTSANSWTAWYTPYAYPHPIREVAGDVTAPTMSGFSPANGATVVCADASDPYTASSHAISLSTNENATCKWDTTVDGTPTYAELSNTFTGTGTQAHTATLTGVTCGGAATVYYACQDAVPNTSTVSSWSFNVTTPADVTPPVITNTTAANQACAGGNSLLMTVSTNEPSTCKWSATSEEYDDADYYFSVSGGQTVHHSVNITGQACSATVNRYISCMDTQENKTTIASGNITIPITTDAGKSVTGIDLGTGPLTISIGSGTLNINIIP